MARAAVIFDLDGTLIDAFDDIAAAINRPLMARGIEPHPTAKVREFVGSGVGKLIERATPLSHHHELEAIREEMMEHYTAHGADLATVYPGARETVIALREEGWPIGLLTNKPHVVTLTTCEKLDLTALFDDIQGQDGVSAPRKPDPQALLQQLERLSVETAVMVGDGKPDGQVARAAGIPFIGCTYGTQTRQELEEFSPAAIAESASDLLPLIRECLAGVL